MATMNAIKTSFLKGMKKADSLTWALAVALVLSK